MSHRPHRARTARLQSRLLRPARTSFTTLQFELLETRTQLASESPIDIVAESPEYYGELAPAASESELAVGDPQSAALTAAEVFALHSLPGAFKVIYLDFDGHTTSGTAWNQNYTDGDPFTTPAYSFEGDSTFSRNELMRIEAIWQRVAEDFLPFNVDVTTQDPGVEALRKANSSDNRYGIRLVIGGSASDWYSGGAGGVAYVGSFDYNTDTPAFVFEENLSDGGEKSVAEAASHEAGHTLGLHHDGASGGVEYYSGHGSGATGWAPIMGVGYNRSLTQWSRGEYPGADNSSQNDLGIIIQSANGFNYRTDDHGNASNAATPLTMQGFDFAATGVIERTTDRDFFSFTVGAGEVSFQINPAAKGPNLDIFAAIFDSTGAQVVSDNPASQLSATLNATLEAGTYYLGIDGIGKPASGSDHGYTDYASLGFFSVAGQFTPAPVDGDLRGIIWEDENRNGEQDGNELGLGDWTVYLDSNGNGTHDPADEPTTTTAADGSYAFEALLPGTYAVRHIVAPGWEQTHPFDPEIPGSDAHQVVVVAGQTIDDLDFGVDQIPPPEPNADFNSDLVVDGTDFLLWQRGLGAEAPTFLDGDSNADGLVDAADLTAWMIQFGAAEPEAPQVASSATALTSAMPRNAWLHPSDAQSPSTMKNLALSPTQSPEGRVARAESIHNASQIVGLSTLGSLPMSPRSITSQQRKLADRDAALADWSSPSDSPLEKSTRKLVEFFYPYGN